MVYSRWFSTCINTILGHNGVHAWIMLRSEALNNPNNKMQHMACCQRVLGVLIGSMRSAVRKGQFRSERHYALWRKHDTAPYLQLSIPSFELAHEGCIVIICSPGAS